MIPPANSSKKSTMMLFSVAAACMAVVVADKAPFASSLRKSRKLPKKGKKGKKGGKKQLGSEASPPITTDDSLVGKSFLVGTELFQDTVYAQPVIPTAEVDSHALVEGMRFHFRVQSNLNLTNTDPMERDFLDSDYHYGPPELIQYEQVDGQIKLAHYYHPWTIALDSSGDSSGARPTGLVRNQIGGLNDPIGIVASTGTYTNRFLQSSSGLYNSARYLVYAAEHKENGGKSDRLLLGTGIGYPSTTFARRRQYPVKWHSKQITSLTILKDNVEHYLGDGGGTISIDKYTSGAWTSDLDSGFYANFDNRRAVEHIIVYRQANFLIVTLLDVGQDYNSEFAINILPYPDGDHTSRVSYIKWDPTTSSSSDNWRALSSVAMVRSEILDNGGVEYHTYSMGAGDQNADEYGQYSFDNNDNDNRYTVFDYYGIWQGHGSSISVDLADYQLDLSTLKNVNQLYSLTTGSWTYHMNVGLLTCCGTFLFIIVETYDDPTAPAPFFLAGMFPMAFPDTNGLGTPAHLSGGTNKFGGMRFVLNDEDGNAFLMRQKWMGSDDDTNPYDSPIYGLFEDSGEPVVKVNDDTRDPLPSGTSGASNLNGLFTWYNATGGTRFGNRPYNLLLNTAAGFGTDSTNMAQGVSLGDGYDAVYALKRFSLDSVHVAIRPVQETTSTANVQSQAMTMFKNPVDKTWRKRKIAVQTLPDSTPGENNSTDHFEATITLVNRDGNAVSPLTGGNRDLKVEVRADSPCTVTDDTAGLYYDVDRYTSFMASFASDGHLVLTVPADVFSQVLYLRLVNTTLLQESEDLAILNTLDEEYYPWTSVNLALQAQQRMSNGDGSGTSSADETVYMSKDTLNKSSVENHWQYKGEYDASQSNLKDLASYMQTSGTNLITETANLSIGVSSTIDPLNAITGLGHDDSRPLMKTSFAYDTGTISTADSARRHLRVRRNLNLFKGISHELHDALHWLQHTSEDFYKDLKGDGVVIESAVDSISVKISRDIMYAVNGAEAGITQIVTTVEEYASVVVNVVVSIVEETFIYQFIELLIALVSLFVYFDDILSLYHSLKDTFNGFYKDSNGVTFPDVPDSFTSADVMNSFLGPANNLDSTLGGVDSSTIATEVNELSFDSIANNPLTQKLLSKMLSAMEKAEEEIGTALPITFGIDETQPNLANRMAELEDLTETAVASVSTLVVEDAADLIEDLARDVSNPQDLFKSIESDLGTFAEGILADSLSPLYSFMDSVATEAPESLKDVLDYNKFLEFKDAELSDLCKLFGIGSTSGSKLVLSGHEAVFFTLALIFWVTFYQQKGESIDNVKALSDDLGSRMLLTSVSTDGWNVCRLVSDVILSSVGGLIWVGDPDGNNDSFNKFGAMVTFTGAMNDLLFTVMNYDSSGDPLWFDWVGAEFTAVTAALDIGFTFPKGNDNGSWEKGDTTPSPTDITQLFNVFVAIALTGYDTYNAVEDGSDNEIAASVGNAIAVTQLITEFVYNFTPDDPDVQLQYLDWFVPVVSISGPLGFAIQTGVALGEAI